MFTMNHYGTPVVLLAVISGFILCFAMGLMAGADLLSMVFRGVVGGATFGAVVKLFCSYLFILGNVTTSNPDTLEEIE